MANTETGNAGPLGLMGFGMTTILLNMHNAGMFHMGTMILAMGIFYGGLAQIITGILEWSRGNTFGTVAFTSFGLFWESLVFLILMQQWGWLVEPAGGAMISYFILWGIFTFFMWIALLVSKHPWGIQAVFITLWILFFLLALGDATGNAAIKTFTGIEGIICGILAFYVAMCTVIGEYKPKKV
jgi:hypothetical protein